MIARAMRESEYLGPGKASFIERFLKVFIRGSTVLYYKLMSWLNW